MAKSDLELHRFRSEKFRSVVAEAVQFFKKTPLISLPPQISFKGTGVYAIYFKGAFPLYRSLSKSNLALSKPLYVGKAVPSGWRQGRHQTTEAATLFGRLNEHARSITQVTNLEVSEFDCRFMILTGEESDLIVPAEAALIREFHPLWNAIVDGFGNHDPGKGRYEQAKSEWDVLHPGRKWAKRLKGPKPKFKNIENKVENYMKTLN